MSKDPSDMVSDVFRPRDAGDVEVPMNSKSATSDFYVDRSRIGTHEEWEPSKNPMKPGRIVQVKDSIMDNARASIGAMGAKGSFADRGKLADKPVRSNGCGVPCGASSRNPLTKRRGDE